MNSINSVSMNAIGSAFNKFDRSAATEKNPVKQAVDAKTAKFEVAANAAVVKAQDENLGTILDLKA